MSCVLHELEYLIVLPMYIVNIISCKTTVHLIYYFCFTSELMLRHHQSWQKRRKMYFVHYNTTEGKMTENLSSCLIDLYPIKLTLVHLFSCFLNLYLHHDSYRQYVRHIDTGIIDNKLIDFMANKHGNN